MKSIRYFILSVLILSSCAVQALAYYHPDEGRWISRDPVGELGFELVSQRPKSEFERTIVRLRELLAAIQRFDSSLAQRVKSVLFSAGFDLYSPLEERNPYTFCANNPINNIDPLGLKWWWPWPKKPKKPKKPEEECCDIEAAKKLCEEALDAAIGVIKDMTPPQAKVFIKLLQEAKGACKGCEDFSPCSEFAKDPILDKCVSCCLAVNPSPYAPLMCDKICIALGFPGL